MTLANAAIGTARFGWTSGGSPIGPLYPFLDGYQAWAGGCTDADPTYTGYTGGSRGSALTVNPGATTTGTVTLIGQPVKVVKGTTAQSGLQVQAVHTGPGTCPAGNETLTFSQTTAAGTGLVTIALPYGDWRLEVPGKSPSGSWPSVSIRPSTPTPAVKQVTIN